ncbi:hypothetical protein [Serratia liquefaciens]|uniref:hypothetical protein n=1 Tax=Serratia liquefaciens TaxID=614 RepID=UPI0039058928
MTKRIAIHDFVDLIIGKNLTVRKIMNLITKHHPGCEPTFDSLRRRLIRMQKSKYATLQVSIEGREKKFKLVSVDARFFKYSESASAAIKTRGKRPGAARPPHSQAELKYCHMHKMFDQALTSVRERTSA